MTLVLIAVGLLATAAGFVTIGFGIPINAFSLGNTLILSGTIAIGSGLILIALALVLGQLKRIAQALRGNAARMPHIAEPAETGQPTFRATPAPARAAVEPPRPEPSPAEPPRSAQPRFAATASEPEPGPLDWLRAKSPRPVTTPAPLLPAMTEPPMVDPDEAPLSPRSPQRSPSEPSEPKIWSPNRDAAPSDLKPAPRPEQPMPRATPQVQPEQKERFDLVWPDRGAAPGEPRAEMKFEPKVDMPETRPGIEPNAEAKVEPAFDMPLPPVPARPRPAAERRMPEFARKAERAPAILKSGVIDGMPYTLYADGSIEAQLLQGMVKFASVDALRAHLEKQS